MEQLNRLRAGIWLTGGLMLSFSGCAQGTDESPESPVATSRSALSIAEACPETRWVGWSAEGECPRQVGSSQLGYWQVTNFLGKSVPGLAGYCLYEWIPTDASAPPYTKGLPPLGSIEPSDWLARDCQVISPLGELSDQATVWKELRSSFLRMANRISVLPARTGAPPVQVRVAVVDSAVEVYASGKAGYGRMAHGRAVGRAIRELSCPSDGSGTTPCIGMVSNHLALPRVAPGKADYLKGGYFGHQSDLALAIVRAVDSWTRFNRYNRDGSLQPRLVINLSVGWDAVPEYGGAFKEDPRLLPGPARSVHSAITHAACHGAIVVAAAGNRSGGKAPTVGPMFPAAWETKRAPTEEECRKFEGGLTQGPYPVFSGAPSYQPLVYAVGGVDARDLPLAITRWRGRPRLAAHAYHVTSSDGTGHTDILTGTSMAAALVSGVAATVWGYRPSLTAPQVMELVYKSGLSLSPDPSGAKVFADFSFQSWIDWAVRRVSLCRAVGTACASGQERCPSSLPACYTVPRYAGNNPEWSDATWATVMANVGTPGVDYGADAPAIFATTAAPDTSRENKYAMPWVNPQPGWTQCDVCGLSTDVYAGTLYVSTSSSATYWNTATLTVTSGGTQATYDLSSSIDAGTPYATWSVSGIPLSGSVSSATMSFSNASYSTSEPILFW
ncbi:MAG: S8/S53 family peptidase [Deltaproteobacteria bacterium]|nr:S8/S53 family peptidase [Deltaproteobacteria bacterium]